jgi:hypothetical protein
VQTLVEKNILVRNPDCSIISFKYSGDLECNPHSPDGEAPRGERSPNPQENRGANPAPSETLHPKHLLSHPPIRALYGPGLPFRTPLFRNFVQKTPHFYTLFQKNDFKRDLRQSEHFTRHCKTLTEPFWLADLPKNGLGYLKMKKTPFLRVGFTSEMVFLRRRDSMPGQPIRGRVVGT